MRTTIVMGLAAWFAACDAPAPTPATPTPTPTPTPAPDVAPPQPPTAPEPALPGLGPGGAEGRAARRQAVLELLGDGDKAAALPLIDSDPDHPFDLRLAAKLTPTITIVGQSPVVRQREATIVGPYDKPIVRRVVRAHINEIRYCYNQTLAVDPTAGGRVVVDFEILGTGRVGASSIREITMPDAKVGACIAQAVKRWQFPKTEGGVTVKVTYPFELMAPGAVVPDP